MNKNLKIPLPDFPAEIRSIREKICEMSREEFAEKIGIPKATLVSYEMRLRRVPASVWVKAQYLADKAA